MAHGRARYMASCRMVLEQSSSSDMQAHILRYSTLRRCYSRCTVVLLYYCILQYAQANSDQALCLVAKMSLSNESPQIGFFARHSRSLPIACKPCTVTVPLLHCTLGCYVHRRYCNIIISILSATTQTPRLSLCFSCSLLLHPAQSEISFILDKQKRLF